MTLPDMYSDLYSDVCLASVQAALIGRDKKCLIARGRMPQNVYAISISPS